MLSPTTPAGSSYRLNYSGEIGVSGSGVTQSVDLSSLPDGVKQDSTFEDNFQILVSPGAGISNVSSEASFSYDANGVPISMDFTLDSTDAANLIEIELWYLHSAIR